MVVGSGCHLGAPHHMHEAQEVRHQRAGLVGDQHLAAVQTVIFLHPSLAWRGMVWV